MSVIDNKHIQKLIEIFKIMNVYGGINPKFENGNITSVKVELNLKLDDINRILNIFNKKENEKVS